MCGIGGYFCTKEYDQRLQIALPMLGVYMRERGKQSWGITDGVDVMKYKGDFIDGFNGQFQGSKTALLHTRFATFGDQVAENSHPFKIGPILGVHNGQIYNHRDVAKKYEIEYKVDSEILFHQLVAGRDMDELEGYGAVVFFENGVIHIGRFNGGQMSLVKTDFGWIWASTADAVNHTLQIAGMSSAARFDVKLKEGRLYRLVGDQIVKDDRRLNIKERKSYATSYSTGYGGIREFHSPRVRKTWSMAHHAWVDDAGNVYTHYDDDTPKQKALPLPTAETTTFTEEPGSDYDEVIDTQAAADIEEDEDACAFCHSASLATGCAVVGGYKICMDCFDQYHTAVSKGARVNDMPPHEYEFELLKADDFAFFNQLEDLTCTDCQNWLIGDEAVYVEIDDPDFYVCEDCYFRNYHEEDEQVEAALVDAVTAYRQSQVVN